MPLITTCVAGIGDISLVIRWLFFSSAGGAKLYNRWHVPGTIVEVKSPYSYIVELDGKKQHVYANKMKRFNKRIEQA